jgi:hypothetical protein
MAVRKVPGTKLANDATGEVVYTPPEVESRLRDKLAVNGGLKARHIGEENADLRDG